jgi:hypothetical protein
MTVKNKCFAYAALLNWLDPETFTVHKMSVVCDCFKCEVCDPALACECLIGAHYFVKDSKGNIIDPTASQYPFKLDYSKAKRVNRFWGKRLPRQSQNLLNLARQR